MQRRLSIYFEKGTLEDSSVLTHGLNDIGEYKGKTIEKATQMITDCLKSHSLGDYTTQFKIRDWLISRQRYWGAPDSNCSLSRLWTRGSPR